MSETTVVRVRQATHESLIFFILGTHPGCVVGLYHPYGTPWCPNVEIFANTYPPTAMYSNIW